MFQIKFIGQQYTEHYTHTVPKLKTQTQFESGLVGTHKRDIQQHCWKWKVDIRHQVKEMRVAAVCRGELKSCFEGKVKA